MEKLREYIDGSLALLGSSGDCIVRGIPTSSCGNRQMVLGPRFTQKMAAIEMWPRNLEHVQTMTSLKWQPRHKYGDCTEPSPNVISLTWDARVERRRNGRCLCWSRPWLDLNVPRIDPIRFSNHDPQHLIKKSLQYCCRKSKRQASNTMQSLIIPSCLAKTAGEEKPK